MAILSISHDFARFAATLSEIERSQLPAASMRALTRTAIDAKARLQSAMRSAFDKPKPWTINSLYVEVATKAKLEANVHFKDAWATDLKKKGVPAGRYLRSQILGGPRHQTSTEKRLASIAGVIPPGYYLVPTKHADKDAFGNMSPGQIAKIRSFFNANPDVGVTSNANGKRGKGVRRNESYFAIVPGRPQGRGGNGGGLPPGIYKVVQSAFGRAVLPVAALVGQAPTYSAKFDFDGIAAKAIEDRLAVHMREALDWAMATRRK